MDDEGTGGADGGHEEAVAALAAEYGDRLFAYALPLVGTVPGTPAGEVAARAVRDALGVAAARPFPTSPAPTPDAVPTSAATGPAARLVALTRNECLRQLRARNTFVDTRADVWLPASAAPHQLVAAAFLGLAPGDRDALAVGWVTGLAPAAAARAVAAGSVTGLGRRQSGARDALAASAGATALVADPGRCAALAGLLAPPARPVDSDPPTADRPTGRFDATGITPALRDAITLHARGCQACGSRRRTFLADALPGFALPASRVLPPESGLVPSAAVDVVARAGALDAEGFPVPLDHDDVVGMRALRWAVLAGVVSAGLLLLGSLVYLAVAR